MEDALPRRAARSLRNGSRLSKQRVEPVQRLIVMVAVSGDLGSVLEYFHSPAGVFPPLMVARSSEACGQGPVTERKWPVARFERGSPAPRPCVRFEPVLRGRNCELAKWRSPSRRRPRRQVRLGSEPNGVLARWVGLSRSALTRVARWMRSQSRRVRRTGVSSQAWMPCLTRFRAGCPAIAISQASLPCADLVLHGIEADADLVVGPAARPSRRGQRLESDQYNG